MFASINPIFMNYFEATPNQYIPNLLYRNQAAGIIEMKVKWPEMDEDTAILEDAPNFSQ
ncbi:Uncharacterised protein [Mycobacteroides abscessus subsp. abscessus]|nr:Uncharacterised protein [Mycobacteroides abscessus subsp. abscessus]